MVVKLSPRAAKPVALRPSCLPPGVTAHLWRPPSPLASATDGAETTVLVED